MAVPRPFAARDRPPPVADDDGAALAAFHRGDAAAIERCYRDYFDDEQVRQIDAFVDCHLLPGFGYGNAPAAPGPRVATA